MSQRVASGYSRDGRKEQAINPLRVYLRECEREWLIEGLARHGGNGVALAAELGVNRQNLGRLLRIHGLTKPRGIAK